jgi:hypothetical protein
VISLAGVVGGAYAASVVAARSATCRAVKSVGEDRTLGKRRPLLTAVTHRRNVAHPSSALFPMIFQGLVRALTAHAESRATPKSANAHPIADAVYSRCDRVS